MKYLLVADTHLGIKKASERYHNVVYNLFEEIINVCKEINITEVIHLGDFFHERKVTNTKTLSILKGSFSWIYKSGRYFKAISFLSLVKLIFSCLLKKYKKIQISSIAINITTKSFKNIYTLYNNTYDPLGSPRACLGAILYNNTY